MSDTFIERTTLTRAQVVTMFGIFMTHSKSARLEIGTTDNYGTTQAKIVEEEFNSETLYNLRKNGGADLVKQSAPPTVQPLVSDEVELPA